jgi:hypothetical protein
VANRRNSNNSKKKKAITLSEIKDMFIRHKKEIEILFKEQEKVFVDLLSDNLKIINARLDNAETKTLDCDQRIHLLENDIKDLKESLNFYEHLIDQKVKAASDSKDFESPYNITILNEKCRISEDRSRRSNLRIDGIPENVNETWDETEQKVQNLLCVNLGVKGVEIERAHRVGFKKETRSRTIILKLLRFKDKSNILKETRKLKGLNIYVNEDFSQETASIRRKLFSEAKERKLNGENVIVRYDKLIILKNVYNNSK